MGNLAYAKIQAGEHNYVQKQRPEYRKTYFPVHSQNVIIGIA